MSAKTDSAITNDETALMGVGVHRLVRPSRPLAPKGGNDRIYTPDDTAKMIVNHFQPCGRILEPCAGRGAFVRALNGECEECEIDEGTDFMKWTAPVDWIVTNPPWSKFRDFLRHGMEVSNNIVFLCLINAWFMRARQRDMQEMGFGLVEVLHVPVPPAPWPQAGFSLGAGWIKRGWTGGVHFSWPNVKEHAPLSAGASVDHGVEVETTQDHVNRAADRGCVTRLVLRS